MNTILNGQPELSHPNFALGLVDWMRRLIQAGLLLLALGAVLLVASIPGSMSGLQVFCGVLALACAVMAFTPQLLYGSSSFIADPAGIYFPHHSKRRIFEWNQQDQWLLVPWSNVSAINVAPVLAGEHGLKPGLVLLLDVDSQLENDFFAYLHAPFLRSRDEKSRLKVSYSTAFQSPYSALHKLQSMQSVAASENF